MTGGAIASPACKGRIGGAIRVVPASAAGSALSDEEGAIGSGPTPAADRPVRDRDLRDDERSLPGRALDRDAPAQRGDPVLEAVDPRAARRVGAADAVVADLDVQGRPAAVGPDAGLRRPWRTWPRWRVPRRPRNMPLPRRAGESRPIGHRADRPSEPTERSARAVMAGPRPASVRIAGWMPRASSRNSWIASLSSAAAWSAAAIASAFPPSACSRRCRSSRSASDRETSRCCAPSCRSRSSRRRSSSVASTMRARERRISASAAR